MKIFVRGRCPRPHADVVEGRIFLLALSPILNSLWLLRVSCEEEFTAEAQSSRSSENSLIKNSLLRALRASAVQSPSSAAQGSQP